MIAALHQDIKNGMVMPVYQGDTPVQAAPREQAKAMLINDPELLKLSVRQLANRYQQFSHATWQRAKKELE